jgi:5-methylcytosine-specific restriction endonuclease McrA
MNRRAVRLRLVSEHPFCRYCGRPVAIETSSLDHVVPRSRGGTNAPSNLALVCRNCNTRKSDLLPREIMAWARAVLAAADASGT